MCNAQEATSPCALSASRLKDLPPSRRHVLVVAVIVAVAYLAGVTGRWWPTSDSAMYLTLGRSLAEGEGFRFNGEVKPYASPGLPFVLAGINRLFGQGFWIPNLSIALCGIGAFVLIYLSLARLNDRRTALLAALATALSYRFYHKAHEILTDMPLVVVFWAVLYAAIRFQDGKWLWVLLAAGLVAAAGAVRVPGLLPVAALGIALALDRSKATVKGRRLVVGALILAATAATGVGLYALGRSMGTATPAYTPQVQMIQLSVWAGLRQLMATLSEIIIGGKGVLPLGGLILFLSIVGSVCSWRAGRRIVPISVVVYAVMLFFVPGPPAWAIQSRYWMPISAMSYVLVMEGLWGVIAAVARYQKRPLTPRAFLRAGIVLAAITIACTAPRTMRWAFYYAPLSYGDAYYAKVRDGAFREMHSVADTLTAHCGPEDRVGLHSDQLSKFHFLTRRRMTPYPGYDHVGPDDAARIMAFIADHPELRLLVFEKRNAEPVFWEAMTDRLDRAVGEGDLDRVFCGEDYHVYRRVGSRPASRSKGL